MFQCDMSLSKVAKAYDFRGVRRKPFELKLAANDAVLSYYVVTSDP